MTVSLPKWDPSQVIWIDVAGGTSAELWKRLEELELPVLEQAHVGWLLGSEMVPEAAIDRMRRGDGILGLRLPGFTGVGGTIQAAHVALLAGEGWLVTRWRDESLARPDVGRRAQGGAADLGGAVVRDFIRRSTEAAVGLADRMEFHLAADPVAPVRTKTVGAQGDLLALRDVLSLGEGQIRQRLLLGDELDTWLDGMSDGGLRVDVVKADEQLGELLAETRRALSDALAWLSLQAIAGVVRRQEDASIRDQRWQRLVAVLTTVVLGPGLVAAVFGAMPNWFADCPWLRAGALAAAMVVTACLVGWLLRDRSAG